MKGSKFFYKKIVRLLCQNLYIYFTIPTAVVLASVIFYCGLPTTVLADTTYTVDSIAEALLTAEARFTNLRIDYIETKKGYNKPDDPVRVVEAVYAQKMLDNQDTPTRLRYHDRKVTYIDPNTKKTTYEDMLVSFDGTATTILYRKSPYMGTEPNSTMKGYIISGYDSNQFSGLDLDPHNLIWYHARRGLGEILKDSRTTAYIERQSEVLDGISTVKVVSTQVYPNKKSLTIKLWVSPERGFLPLKRQLMQTGGRFYSETALYDLVQLPNGMWYPKTIRSPADPPGAPNFVYTTTYNISNISIEPIPKEFFTPEFPPNTHVIDDITKTSYTTY